MGRFRAGGLFQILPLDKDGQPQIAAWESVTWNGQEIDYLGYGKYSSVKSGFSSDMSGDYFSYIGTYKHNQGKFTLVALEELYAGGDTETRLIDPSGTDVKKPDWGEAINGLRCRIELPELPIVAGDRIPIIVALKNCSDEPITLSVLFDEDGLLDYRFIIKDQSGFTFKTQFTYIDTLGFFNRKVQIKPGLSYRRRVYLYPYREEGKEVLEIPGHYEMTVKFPRTINKNYNADYWHGNVTRQISSLPTELVVVPDDAAIGPTWGDINNDVKIGLRLRKSEFTIGEDIPIEICMQCASSSSSVNIYDHRFNIHDYFPYTFFEVICPDGGRKVLTRPVGKMAIPDFTPFRYLLKTSSWHGKDYVHPVKLNQWRVKGDTLNKDEDQNLFATPGIYKITCTYSTDPKTTRIYPFPERPNFDVWSDTVTSNPIEVKIVSAKEKALQAKKTPASVPQTIYFYDFEKKVSTEWSSSKTDMTPLGKRHFLGQFANETVTLFLEKLPLHKEVTLSFDLFIIRSWDGNHPQHGRDIFNLSARNVGTLLHTTFSNWIHEIKGSRYIFAGKAY